MSNVVFYLPFLETFFITPFTFYVQCIRYQQSCCLISKYRNRYVIIYNLLFLSFFVLLFFLHAHVGHWLRFHHFQISSIDELQIWCLWGLSHSWAMIYIPYILKWNVFHLSLRISSKRISRSKDLSNKLWLSLNSC